ncbi:MAG: DEAD/DEAH box helicase [Bacteriovoracaceae bacterium]|nr:DEAD/DEAH box helicase [Bacteriovoracaceae bacterium]
MKTDDQFKTNIKLISPLNLNHQNHENNRPAPKSKLGPYHFSSTEYSGALKYLEQDLVVLKTVDNDGMVRGLVNGLASEIHFQADGTLLINKDTSAISPNKAAPLALSLFLIKILSEKKQSASIKKIISQAPKWLSSNYRLADEVVEDSKNLQAYWVLLNMAKFPKNKLPADKLVDHVFKIYQNDSWQIQHAAMESLIKRIKSSMDENLSIASRPPQGKIAGSYEIRRKGVGVLEYEILLGANSTVMPFDASCSCKDFQKNTLHFCKHTATVWLYWNENEKKKKQLAREHSQGANRLHWLAETGMKKIFFPLDGLMLSQRPSSEFKKYFSSLPNAQGLYPFQNIFKLPHEKSQQISSLEKILQSSKKLWIDPVVFPLLKREKEKLWWPILYQTKKNDLWNVLKKTKIKLYPYQDQGVKRSLERGKMLLGDDMGLGKTIQAITWAESLLQAKVVKKILVITPASLKSQWQREWGSVSNRPIVIVEGGPEDRKKIYESNAPVTILNYELLLRDFPAIEAMNVSGIILDEAQRIKNYASQTSQLVKKLHPPFRLVLTGTPMENRISELASLMDWIDDHAMGPGWRLDAELTMESSRGIDQGSKGVQGLKLLRERIAPHFLRRTRGQVLGDLPKRTDSVRIIPFTDEQKSIHDDYAGEVAKLMNIANKRPLRPEEHIRLMSYMTNMRIVSNALAQYDYENIWDGLKNNWHPEKKLNYLSSPKLIEFRNLVEGLLSQDKVKIVIFSQWQRMLRLAHWSIRDFLKEDDVEAVFFTGKETQNQRTSNIVRFHDDPKVRIFFASDAGGVGLNLQRAATVCINLELPWNPAVLEQRIARIHRLGQKNPIQVYNFVTQESIEERISRLVGNKKAVFNALFDSNSDQIIFEDSASFYKQVREVVSDKSITTTNTNQTDGDNTDELAVTPDEVSRNLKDLSDEIEKIDPAETAVRDIVHHSDTANDTKMKNRQGTSFNPFANIKIERSASGSIKIEADKESAEMLSIMFSSMAKLFEKTALH